MPAEVAIQAQTAPHSLGLRPRSLSGLAFMALPWALAARFNRALAPFLVGFLVSSLVGFLAGRWRHSWRHFWRIWVAF